MSKKKLNLDKKLLEKNKLTISEYLTLLGIANRLIPKEHHEKLLKNRFIAENKHSTGKEDEFYITNTGKRALENIIYDVSHKGYTDDELRELAEKMQAIYPGGKKPGTNYYWRNSSGELVRKLKEFFKKYGTSFTENQILNATKRYVESYSNNTTYMQLLKYFILKTNRFTGEEASELASYMENEDTVENTSTDWTTTLK